MGSGRAQGLRRLACALLATATAWSGSAAAQSLTPDMLNPARDPYTPAQAQAQKNVRADALPLRPTTTDGSEPAPSRIGKLPTYGTEASAGAGGTGFNALNKRKPPKPPYPGAPKPKKLGPGTVLPDPAAPTPLVPSTFAHKPPVPPAAAGTVPGQPPRRRLKPDTDPFGPVGDYIGSFLVKGALEIGGGYDTNPGRFVRPQGSAFYMVSPELTVASDWLRHSLAAELRGSFTGYGKTFPDCGCASGGASATISPVPEIVDRPDVYGKVNGRFDISRDTRLLGEGRLRIATDNPGSPNIQFGLKRYPLFFGTGATLGAEQDFNRLQLTMSGTLDRVAYQDSVLTDGSSTTNIDRNFNQAGFISRASYEILPGLRPFGEISGDTRVHDVNIDRGGYQRDSRSLTGKAGSTFEFTRLITGEFAVGYGVRSYQDPRLNSLTGLLTTATLTYLFTPLTTVKFIANSSLDETTLPGASGVLVRTYTGEVAHDFRRWLTGIGRFTYGTLDYQGGNRTDTIYSASADVIYRLNRTYQIKAQLRRDWLDSTLPGYSTASVVMMLGVRVQN